jgi:hypothetical protein
MVLRPDLPHRDSHRPAPTRSPNRCTHEDTRWPRPVRHLKGRGRDRATDPAILAEVDDDCRVIVASSTQGLLFTCRWIEDTVGL